MASRVLRDHILLRCILRSVLRDGPLRVVVRVSACRGLRDAAARLASPLAIERVVRLMETWEWMTFASRERGASRRESASVTRLVHALVLDQAHEWWTVCPFRIHAIGDVARNNNRGLAWPARFEVQRWRRKATALLAACGAALDDREPIAHLLDPRLPRKRTVKSTNELHLLMRDSENAGNIERYGTCAAYDIRPLEELPQRAFESIDGDFDVTFWDTSHVTNMSHLAFGLEGVRLRGIELWNTARVEHMRGAFWLARFDQDIGGWDVGRVVSMSRMFGDSTFNQDIGKWDVSNVGNMDGMFTYAASFDRDLSSWRVGHVTSCTNMFRNCPLPAERRPRVGVTVVGPGASAMRHRIEVIVASHVEPVEPMSVLRALEHVVCVDRRDGPTRIEINRSMFTTLAPGPDDLGNPQFLAVSRRVCRDIVRHACAESSDVRFNWVAPLNKPSEWTCTTQRAKDAKEASEAKAAADAAACAVS
jgi:hypothetical protein